MVVSDVKNFQGAFFKTKEHASQFSKLTQVQLACWLFSALQLYMCQEFAVLDIAISILSKV